MLMNTMHPGFCPQCGERVTPYAAGCALCGADLDPLRWQRPLSLGQRLSIRLPRSVRVARLARGAKVRVRP
jgi:predicted amidophosphoribosyltransferase